MFIKNYQTNCTNYIKSNLIRSYDTEDGSQIFKNTA